jgi:hypothetical protein
METARIRLLRLSRPELLPWLSMFLGVPYERLDAGSLLRADKEWNTSPQKKSLNAQIAVSEKVSLRTHNRPEECEEYNDRVLNSAMDFRKG